MIRLLALGIPGEALTAMMLSVFYVHNVIPGPQLFESRPEFIMGLFLSLLLTNFIILGFLLLTTRWLIKITVVDPRWRVPDLKLVAFVESPRPNPLPRLILLAYYVAICLTKLVCGKIGPTEVAE